MGGVICVILLIAVGLLVKQVFPIWYAGYMLTFLLGGYMADEKNENKLTTNRVYGISALVLVACWCVYPLESSSIGKLCNLLLMFIIGPASCITFFNIFKKMQLPKYISAYFSEIGKYTLVLYLVPILILPSKNFFVEGRLTVTAVNLVILAVGVAHSLVSYAIGRVIYEIPYLRFILFGKK